MGELFALIALISFALMFAYSIYYWHLDAAKDTREQKKQVTKYKLIFFIITFIGSLFYLFSHDMLPHQATPVENKITYICEEHPNCTEITSKAENSTWEKDSGIEFAKELDRINTAAQLDAIDDEIRAIKKYRK